MPAPIPTAASAPSPRPSARPVVSHATSAPDACSVVWDQADDPSVYGTAAPARFWLAVEQNGPWGRNAAVQSHLPRDLGRELERRCAAEGGRLCLIRRPGSHADLHRRPRRCYVGWSGWPGPDGWHPAARPTANAGTRRSTGSPAFLLVADVDDDTDLLRLDLVSAANGDLGGVERSLPGLHQTEPIVLICTNGRRDVCCAIRGRPVAAAGDAARPDRVWECSHTGGHRFSPTGVLLPWGRTLARLDDTTVADVVDAADVGRVPAGLLGGRHDRGWSALSPREQAAESAVRATLGETALSALTATPGPGAAIVVSHRDGRRWTVDLAIVDGDSLQNSCGDLPLTSRTWAPTVREG